jgi:hypothetical protein
MKYTILILVLFSVTLFPQILDVRGSMGIIFMSTPSLRDYLNQQYRTGAELSSFNSAVNFGVESNYYLSDSFAAGMEFVYVLNSFSFTNIDGKRELTNIILMPSLVASYVLAGAGYNFKFGGGAGLRFSNVNENFPLYSIDHSSTGFGLLLKTDGNTLLGGNLYANIGAEMRYDVNGSFIAGRSSDIEVNLDSFSVALRLGLTYFIL